MLFANSFISSSTNFGSLTTLICHLIIGGNFQVAHLFYDSTSLHGRLVNEIACLDEVSWIGIDVNSGTPEWYYQDRKDQTIQLIFPNLNAVENFTNLENFTVYYRAFIFLLDKVTKSKMELIFDYGDNIISSTQGSLLLIHDIYNRHTEIRLFTQKADEDPIHIQKESTGGESVVIFKKTYDTFDRMWLLGANYPSGNDGKFGSNRDLFLWNVVTSRYFAYMNLDFISRTTYNNKNSNEWFSREFVRHIPQSIYAEFSHEYELLDNVTT